MFTKFYLFNKLLNKCFQFRNTSIFIFCLLKVVAIFADFKRNAYVLLAFSA
nr:MAG TPA: hypothetical protein [Caudoviricetes sp.]